MPKNVTGAQASAYQAKNPNVTSAKMTPKIQANPVAYPTAKTAPKLTSAHGGLGEGYQMSGKDGGPALPKPIDWAALAPKPVVPPVVKPPVVAAPPVVKPPVVAPPVVKPPVVAAPPVVKPAPKPYVPPKPAVKGAPPNATPGPKNTSGYYLPGSSNLWFPGGGSGDHWKGGSGGVKNAAQARAQAAGKAHYNDPRNVLARELANKKSAASKPKLKKVSHNAAQNRAASSKLTPEKKVAAKKATELANKKSAANKNKNKKPKYSSSRW